jgi:hypothetical protein
MMPAAKIRGGSVSALSVFQWFKASVVMRRSWSLGVACCNFQVFQGVLCKIVRDVLPSY